MHFHKHIISIFVSSLFALTVNQAQAAEHKVIDHQNAKLANMGLNSMIGLNKNYEFRTIKTIKLPNGKVKHRIAQFYNNVRVFGESIAITTTNAGAQAELFGSYLASIEKDVIATTPKLSQSDVIELMLNKIKVGNEAGIENKQADLFIMQDVNKKARLVYRISFMLNSDHPSRPSFIIDANTGEIIKQWDGLTTREAVGPGGNEKVGKYYYGKDYGPLEVNLRCQMSTPNVSTYNMNGRLVGGILYKFDCPENTYKEINGAYSPLNDAHYFGNVVFDMYKEWFDTAPLNTKLKLRVHFGKNFENAFWNGQQMTFGDGASRFYPLVSLDVVSHEVSHGFTEQNSGLTYSEQSGGINEAFSDMAGEASKYFANANKAKRNDWLVGSSITKEITALRYFEDPTLDGQSIGNAEDYYDGLDVHYSSGVYNKAFYTLATKSDWNVEKAFRVFVLANQMYWNENSNFITAACGVKKAADDLGFDSQAVIDAFNVVGVDARCS